MLIISLKDGCWSAQEDKQLQGRVWRIGQRSHVVIYRILILQTADISLNVIASDKAIMQSAVLGDNQTILRMYLSPECLPF